VEEIAYAKAEIERSGMGHAGKRRGGGWPAGTEKAELPKSKVACNAD
jgi:hypothetical protein